MTTYEAKKASYASTVDMLYVLLDPNGDLSACSSIEDTPSGITVMYDRAGNAIGAEVPDFMEDYGVPATIPVDSKRPFNLHVSSAAGIR